MSSVAEPNRNLPQTLRAIKHIARLLYLSAVPALMATSALACDSLEEILFVCGTGVDAAEGSIALCGFGGKYPDEYTGVQFRLDAGATQVVYPADPSDDVEKLAFSNTNGPDGYLVDVRFSDGDTGYRVYSLATPPESADDVGGGTAGVVVTAPDGTKTDISCGERPYMFISYMRNAMRCDESNPLGAAACNPDSVPDRKSPLGDEAGAPMVID